MAVLSFGDLKAFRSEIPKRPRAWKIYRKTEWPHIRSISDSPDSFLETCLTSLSNSHFTVARNFFTFGIPFDPTEVEREAAFPSF